METGIGQCSDLRLGGEWRREEGRRMRVLVGWGGVGGGGGGERQTVVRKREGRRGITASVEERDRDR